MELFKIISDYFRRIVGLVLALSIIGGPINGWIDRHKDNGIVSQKSYVDFTSDFVAELLFKEDDEGLIAEPTKTAARNLVRAVIVQFILGEDENDTITKIAEAMPHGDYPHTAETKWRTNALEKLIHDIISGENSIFPENIEHTLRALSDGLNDVHVYFGDTQFENVYEFRSSYFKDNGELVMTGTGIYYDSSTGVIYGKDNNGIYGIGFDFDTKRYLLTTPTDAWQRKFGFNIGYDILGDIIFMDCDTVRIKFDYKGTERMVQIWKGNYSPFSNGAEIGLYVKDESKILHYNCVGEDEQLPMSMVLSAKGKKIFDYSSPSHWWLAGFKVGPAINKNLMVLDFEIDFKDEEFATLFCEAAAKKGITTQRTGAVVSGSWK